MLSADHEAETGDEIETAAETDTGDAEVTVEIVTDIVIDTETGVEAEIEGNARIDNHLSHHLDTRYLFLRRSRSKSSSRRYKREKGSRESGDSE